ncbi:hypothetical protein QMK17_13725 [Rhodococcus sp. G-MC3]|uniref:hypothetical protein n=1 Tax=Rhodococcus sp. G-MC3 TaxID=3046209 RepID=UPI0024B9C1B0|nr:hypothetical protein [Rhodococcus sp. G-MC3]MDJ0394387.1 hypothetical protein [Rhodococcus sp. G-MC3]
MEKPRDAATRDDLFLSYSAPSGTRSVRSGVGRSDRFFYPTQGLPLSLAQRTNSRPRAAA